MVRVHPGGQYNDLTVLCMDMFSDQIWFVIFEFALAAVSIWAVLKVSALKEHSPVDSVFRGVESHNFLSETTELFLTIVISVVFNISTFPLDGKVFLYASNILLVLYLCRMNGWSTNKLIGIKNSLENQNLNPHGNRR